MVLDDTTIIYIVYCCYLVIMARNINDRGDVEENLIRLVGSDVYRERLQGIVESWGKEERIEQKDLVGLDEVCTVLGMPEYAHGTIKTMNSDAISVRFPDLEYWLDISCGSGTHFLYYDITSKDVPTISRGMVIMKRALQIANGCCIDFVWDKESDNPHEVSYSQKGKELSTNKELSDEVKKALVFIGGVDTIYDEPEPHAPDLKQRIFDMLEAFEFLRQTQSPILRTSEKTGYVSPADYEMAISGYKVLSQLQCLIDLYEQQTSDKEFEERKVEVKSALEGTEKGIINMLARRNKKMTE